MCQALVLRPIQQALVPTTLATSKKKPVERAKKYNFDISKLEEIFDYLQEDGQVKFPKEYKYPMAEELSGKEFCKYPGSFIDSTNNYLVFRNYIQKAIEKGLFKFAEERKQSMEIKKNPFQHMANINMINIGNMTSYRMQSGQSIRLQLVAKC